MCPVLIGIVIDLHKKPRPEPFVKYQFGQRAFLPLTSPELIVRDRGLGWISTCGDLGFFSATVEEQQTRESSEPSEMPLSDLPIDICSTVVN